MSYSFERDRLKKTPQPDAQLGPLLSPGSDNSGVAEPSWAYQKMQIHWDLVKDLRGGTQAVRDKGEAYLPREPFEGNDAYQRRLAKVTLAPWYVRLVNGLVGMVLRKPVTVDGVSSQAEKHLENINLLGDDLSAFARDVFEAAIDYGYTGIFVDYPDTSGIQLRSEELERGDRPYWVHYTAPEIIGTRYQIVGNRRIFTQVRVRETVWEESGDFGETEVEQIKVYDLVATELGSRCRWRTFREVRQQDVVVWQVVGEGLTSLPIIPFTFVYTTKKKDLCVLPPMVEVGHLNVKHYQLSADLDHSLHVSAHPKFCLFGYAPDQTDIVATSDEAIVFDDPNGRAEWTAPPPGVFDPLSNRIDKIELQMAVLGLSTLVAQKNVGESAEAKKLDRVQGDSIMAVIAQGLQDAFDLCLEYHALYLGEEAGTCQVNRDFDVAGLPPQAIDSYSRLHSAGQISLETLLGLLKRGEVFDDEFSIEDELGRLEQEFKKQSSPPKTMPGEWADETDRPIETADAGNY